MPKAKMSIEYNTLTFEWSGGEYIEVIRDGSAVDVINVFDYAEGKPRIATLFDFTARVRNYVEENYGLEPDEVSVSGASWVAVK